MQQIRINNLTKRGIVTSVINRSSLKNYLVFEKIGDRNVWIRKELYNQFFKKATATYKFEKGKTEVMQKPFLRFRFALWRYKITDEERLVELFRKLLKKYQIVKDQGKKYPTQRIGLSIASSDKQYQTFTRSTTGRQNTVEMYDVISTSTYANNDPSTDSMFDELYDKVLKYFYNNNKSPSLLDDDNLKSAKHFFVFFVED